jgi:hypothetical protein
MLEVLQLPSPAPAQLLIPLDEAPATGDGVAGVDVSSIPQITE